MSALFLVQVMVGAASQHYRAELADFFGIDLAQWFPYNLMRTAPAARDLLGGDRVPRGRDLHRADDRGPRAGRQSWLAYGLLGALAIVVGGTLVGGLAAIHGWLDSSWNWLGNQGWGYLDLGRLWQILLTIGLFFWVAMLYASCACA